MALFDWFAISGVLSTRDYVSLEMATKSSRSSTIMDNENYANTNKCNSKVPRKQQITECVFFKVIWENSHFKCVASCLLVSL